MDNEAWKQRAACRDYDTNLFFDTYEEKESIRPAIDAVCAACPVVRQCFAVGITNKEWGVWGGVFLEKGKISREFNKHRDKKAWGEKWKNLTMDGE